MSKETNEMAKCSTLKMCRNLGIKGKDRREDGSRRGED